MRKGRYLVTFVTWRVSELDVKVNVDEYVDSCTMRGMPDELRVVVVQCVTFVQKAVDAYVWARGR